MSRHDLEGCSRRRFLEDSMLATLAAAGAASVGVAPAPLWGQQPVSKNDKIGVAVIGCGSRGDSHVRNFLSDPRTTVRYLCDPDRRAAEQKLGSVADKQPELTPKVVTDLRKALDDPEVHAISIATPNHWHALAALWGMQAGKHCYVEKPVCYNVHEGRALIAASAKYRLVFQTGTQCRTIQAHSEAVAFIRAGGIGEVKFSRGLCYKRRLAIGALGDYPIPTVDYDLWSGPAMIEKLTRPRFHYDWHWQRLYGNGDFGNQGPHQTDVARWHLGIETHPKRILTYGGRLGYQAEKNDDTYIDAGNTANTEVTICDYGDKTIVFETRGLEAPALMHDVKIGVITRGERGYVVQNGTNRSSAFDLDGKLIKEFEGAGSHFVNFVDAIVAGDPSKVTAPAAVGHYSAAISHLGNISYYMGENNRVPTQKIRDAVVAFGGADDNAETLDRTIAHLEGNGVDMKKYPMSLGALLTFDPKTEKFTGTDMGDTDTANAMLTRPYREGFVVPTADKV